MALAARECVHASTIGIHTDDRMTRLAECHGERHPDISNPTTPMFMMSSSIRGDRGEALVDHPT